MVPGFLDDEPPIPEGLEWIWVAFRDLGSCRPIGMGVGPIPWTAIDAYALRHRIKGADFRFFVHVTQAMDSAYLGHVQKKTEKS